MTTKPTDGERREQFAAGLRELADFLLAHPDVPLPDAELLSVAIGDDEKCMADIRATAAGLGVEVSYLNGDTQYPQAVRQFGAIRYMRRASLSQAMARYDALMSYRGLVQPEPAEAGVR